MSNYDIDDKKILKEYELNCYKYSEDFPKEALSIIPQDILQSFDRGNESFFANFQESLPSLYKCLTTETSRVCLLESVFEDIFSGDGEIHKLYYWGLETKGKLLTICIRNKLISPKITDSEREMFKSIPPYLLCFYEYIDGMGFSQFGLGGGIDFPRGFSDLSPLTETGKDIGLMKIGQNKLFSNYQNSDFRILIECYNKDLIAINLAIQKPALYLIRFNDQTNYSLIKKPETLESYFIARLHDEEYTLVTEFDFNCFEISLSEEGEFFIEMNGEDVICISSLEIINGIVICEFEDYFDKYSFKEIASIVYFKLIGEFLLDDWEGKANKISLTNKKTNDTWVKELSQIGYI